MLGKGMVKPGQFRYNKAAYKPRVLSLMVRGACVRLGRPHVPSRIFKTRKGVCPL